MPVYISVKIVNWRYVVINVTLICSMALELLSIHKHAPSRLELTLIKAQPGMWPLVVCGDTRGEMVLDPEQVAHIHERLAHLTSETWVCCHCLEIINKMYETFILY